MSMATRRTACPPQSGLQVEERPPRAPLKATIRSNGNGRVRANGNGHAVSNANAHANGAHTGKSASSNGASHQPAKLRVFVAAENRLLREALSRMLTKNGDIEVLNSEAPELLQRDAPVQFSEPGTTGVPAMYDAEILLPSSKGNLEQDLTAIRKSVWPVRNC